MHDRNGVLKIGDVSDYGGLNLGVYCGKFLRT